MKRIISILLLLIFACTMVTSCSKFGSRQYVLDVLDAMDKGDDERFYEILSDKSYDINRDPNSLLDKFMCYRFSPIENACSLKRYDYAEALIKRGADANYRRKLGALYISVMFLDVKMVELLLENGADPSIGMEYPLSVAAERWNKDSAACYKILEMLIEHGADKSFRDEHFANRNAYEVAIESGAPQEFLDLLNPDK
jgi:hypothetical protein